MRIGHICLAPSGSGAGERFAALVEGIAQHDVVQHVLVADVGLARRLAACKHVTVGPIVKSPVMAYCLMPDVDIAHVHEGKSGQAGLLLTLTRSIPFVITADESFANDKSQMTQSVLQRAAYTMQSVNSEPDNQAACEHLNIYEDALSGQLELPKNSDCRH